MVVSFLSGDDCDEEEEKREDESLHNELKSSELGVEK